MGKKNGSKGSRMKGNTKPSSEKRDSPAKRWVFTLNNYTEEEYKLIKLKFDTLGDNKYIIGKERGEEKLVPHLQGYVNFEKKRRFEQVTKMLGERAHIEKAKGSEDDNIEYCSKEGNYEHKGLKIKKQLKILDESKLYEWQKFILSVLDGEPDDRSIYWFYDKKGCSGKTTFSKYLSARRSAVPLSGKGNDILFGAATFESDIYIYSLSRTVEDFVSYDAIEKVKDGYYLCGKYESKPIIRNNPHFIVFANFEPDKRKLSKDRWKIYKIKDNSIMDPADDDVYEWDSE